MIHNYYFAGIIDIVKRTENTMSLITDRPPDFYYHPGQFIMLWRPGHDEKPFAVSMTQKDRMEITFKIAGEFTRGLSHLSKNDNIGIRGPFGNGFNRVIPEESLIIAGGVGIASISQLSLDYPEILLLYGSRTRNDIIFTDRFSNCIYSTDDGTYGKKGLITDIFREHLKSGHIRTVYSCGPEKMLYNLMLICRENKVRLFASLERYMKCGIGVCGQCVMDDRVTCIDGPVFDDDALIRSREFGKIRYNKAGQQEPV